MRTQVGIVAVCVVGALSAGVASAQPPVPSVANSSPGEAAVRTVTPPPDYVIGPEDQLSVVFYQDKDMSADVVVRPDGKISLPLINDLQVGGLTPDQLRNLVNTEAKRFIQEPRATVVIRQINSRKVFITGMVDKPGSYPLIGPTTVLQLIATAGGLKEYADSKNIVIIRNDNGVEVTLDFNYKEIVARKNMKQNILLRPGDTVVVPE